MTSKAVLILAVLLAAGCRSDGGLDRLDCAQGMDFATRSFVTQTEADIAATRAWFTSLPGTFTRSSAKSSATLHNTLQLYLDAHEAR